MQLRSEIPLSFYFLFFCVFFFKPPVFPVLIKASKLICNELKWIANNSSLQDAEKQWYTLKQDPSSQTFHRNQANQPNTYCFSEHTSIRMIYIFIQYIYFLTSSLLNIFLSLSIHAAQGHRGLLEPFPAVIGRILYYYFFSISKSYKWFKHKLIHTRHLSVHCQCFSSSLYYHVI